MTTDDVLNGRAKWCVEHSRCEAFSSALPDGCVNLLWLDPPYFRVVDEEWDRAWKTEADFLAWLRSVVREAARVLAPNGSLYLFASPQMGGRVECIARESLDVLNHLVWAKRQGWHAKAEEEALRGYFPQTERVIFAEPHGADTVALGESGYAAKCDAARAEAFAPLRAYLADEIVPTQVRPSGHRLGAPPQPLDADPVRLEIFNGLFMSIAEEMGVALQNTASSVNIKERLDFSCALFDADGGLVANAPHMPVHLGSMSE